MTQREFKFRAFERNTGKMYWFDIMWGNHNSGNGYIGMVPWGEPQDANGRYRGNMTLVDPHECEIMQFTGLLDKHGKEIWEGDILSDGKGGLGEVEYRAPQFVVWADDEHYALAEGKINMTQLNYTEVIGNIFDTPADGK